MAGAALLFFAAIVVASAIRRRRPSSGARAATIAALVLLALVIAIVLRTTATQMAGSLGISLEYVEPGPLGYLAPMMFGGFAFVVGSWALRGAWTGRRAFVFYAWLVGFTAANVINWCSPGWCETVGFPFTWRSWSDVIMEIEGAEFLDVLAAASKAIGGGLNLATFAALAHVIGGRRFRIGSRQLAAGRSSDEVLD